MADSDTPRTFTDRIASAVLRTCRVVDPDSVLSTCTRDHSGRTLVKLRAGSKHTATELASALKSVMPLAFVATEQDLLSGENTATVSVPTEQDEWNLADARASNSKISKTLRSLMTVLFLLAVGAWISHAHTSAGIVDDAQYANDRDI
ncbi:MAG: hypothetical protein ACKVI4_13815 [Actinomycetales bacterium]|tara:strand:+ start:230 stop:673 length:444 start_codon:yes stop_codon:yes gene_type:complete